MNRFSAYFVMLGLAIFLLYSTAEAKDIWVSVDKNFIGDPIIKVKKSDILETVIDVNIGRLFLKDIKYKGQDFVWLDVENAAQTSDVGKPRLPVIRKLIQVPFDTQVSVEAIGGKEVRFNLSRKGFDLPIFPVQPPIPKIVGAKEAAELVMDEDFYNLNEFLPHELVKIAHEGIIRGRRVVTLEIYPVRYNPKSGEVSVITGFEVRLKTIPLEGKKPTFMYEERLNDIYFDQFLKGFVIVPKHKSYYVVPSTYLVIAAPEFFGDSQLLDFVTSKRKRGFNVVVVSTSETGTTNAQIRNYIKNALNTWDYPPSFVLLVGDTNTIPHWTGCGFDNPASDLYYAALDATSNPCNDYFPDLFIGRFPVRTIEQLHNLVNKTQSFEWLLESGYDWIKKATFLASTDNYQISEGTHNYVISAYLDPAGYTSYKRYTKTYNANTQQVINDINAGLSLVIYSGHGSTDSWADGPPMSQAQVRNLTNTYYPFVQSYSCLTGSYELPECFGETWVRDDKAAFAFWGSSVTSFWDEDDILERRVFDGFFAGDAGVYYTWAGGMINYGMIKLYEHYGNTTTIQRYFEMYNIMGDPAIDVWTAPPVNINPSYAPALPIGATSYTVTLSEPEARSAIVSLLFEDELMGAARAVNGVANIQFDDPIEEPGEYLLSIVGHNILPFEATIHVIAVSSDGVVAMDRDVYGGNDTIIIYLSDADLKGVDTHNVQIKSDSYTTPISVTLTELGSNTGIFKGSINTTPARKSRKANLPVSHGDTITVIYIDANDGHGGHNVQKTDTATVDLAPPSFDGLQSATGELNQVRLLWNKATDTSKPITYLIFKSTKSGEYDFDSPIAEVATTEYVDTDVINYVTYYYVVRAKDALGNVDSNTVEKSAEPIGPVCFFKEDFESRSVLDWTIIDNNSDGATWSSENPMGRTSRWLQGTFFIADSGTTNNAMNEDLISPEIDSLFFKDIELKFSYEHSKNTFISKGEVFLKCGYDGAWLEKFDTLSSENGIASVKVPSSMDECKALFVMFSYEQSGALNDSYFGVDNIELCGNPLADPFPEADFSADVTEGTAPLKVKFTDLSKGAVLSRNWDFGDGGSSEEANPVYIYLEPGIYTVSLNVEGILGDDLEVKENYIVVRSPDEEDDDLDGDDDSGDKASSGCGCSF